jgi:uncharacterized membrane protein (DUF485 family)
MTCSNGVKRHLHPILIRDNCWRWAAGSSRARPRGTNKEAMMMEGGLGMLILSGLALISMGYGWALAVGIIGLASLFLILGGEGMLMSTFVLSAVYRVKARNEKGRTRETVLDW